MLLSIIMKREVGLQMLTSVTGSWLTETPLLRNLVEAPFLARLPMKEAGEMVARARENLGVEKEASSVGTCRCTSGA